MLADLLAGEDTQERLSRVGRGSPDTYPSTTGPCQARELISKLREAKTLTPREAATLRRMLDERDGRETTEGGGLG